MIYLKKLIISDKIEFFQLLINKFLKFFNYFNRKPELLLKMYLLPSILFVISTLVAKSTQYFITVDAHSEECFFDRVLAGSRLGLIFEVIEGGFLDIDVKVCKNILFKFTSLRHVFREKTVSIDLIFISLSLNV